MRSTTTPILCLTTLCLLGSLGACRSDADVQAPDEANARWDIEADVTEQIPMVRTPVVEPEPVVEPTPVVEPEPMAEPMPVEEPTPIAEAPALATCEITQLWWDETSMHQLQSELFGWTPDLTAVLQGHSDYNTWNTRRARDGELMHHGWRPSLMIDVDESWSRELIVDHELKETQVRDRDTRQILWSTPQEGFNQSVVMSDDGSHVGTFHCKASEDRQLSHQVITLQEISTQRVVARHEIESGECSYWFTYGNHIAMSPDGSTMAVAHRVAGIDDQGQRTLGDPIIQVVGARDVEEFTLDTLEDFESLNYYSGFIAELIFHPDGKSLHVVTVDGEYVLIDTELSTITPQDKRGAFISNWNTYLPSLPQSPMAWSSDARMKVSVNADGEAELDLLGDLASDAPLFTLRAPELSEGTHRVIPEEQPNAPTSIAISPGDDMILVSFNQGIGVWGCADALPKAQSTLSDLNTFIPSTITASVMTPFTASYTQHLHSELVAIKVYIDGKFHQSFSQNEALELHMYQPGTFDIVIEVDDGLDTMRSTPHQVTVIPVM